MKAALPRAGETITGAFVWGMAMCLSAQAALWISIAAKTSHYWGLAILCLSGGALAFPIAIYLIRLFALGRPARIWFVLSLFFLSMSTLGITALIFSQIYRLYYAQWHDPAFSVPWAYQFVFTTLSAFYQFAVIGTRLYLPVGIFALVCAALMIARRHVSRRQKTPRARFSTS